MKKLHKKRKKLKSKFKISTNVRNEIVTVRNLSAILMMVASEFSWLKVIATTVTFCELLKKAQFRCEKFHNNSIPKL